MANEKMTQKECLAAAIIALQEVGNDDAAERASEWLNQLNKPRKKSGKDSATIQRENRAKEVAAYINEHGPMTAADLAANLDGWPLGTNGKVSTNAVTGCMRTALRLGLVEKDKLGDKGKTRYLPCGWVEPVAEEVEDTEE